VARTVFDKSDAVALVAEVFRDLGYEGASMSAITGRTKLSKGSLYHFFPAGKEQMAAEVLAHIDNWFASQVFEPLETAEPKMALSVMWAAVTDYFRSGGRVCLIGAFALDETRDRFAAPIRSYFIRWIDALAGALMRGGADGPTAQRLAEEAVVAIQGALTLARALNDEAIFVRTIAALAKRTGDALAL
jgi:TetR/AcrR family transcriptional repressor of lmrAB and yxaGH operons